MPTSFIHDTHMKFYMYNTKGEQNCEKRRVCAESSGKAGLFRSDEQTFSVTGNRASVTGARVQTDAPYRGLQSLEAAFTNLGEPEALGWGWGGVRTRHGEVCPHLCVLKLFFNFFFSLFFPPVCEHADFTAQGNKNGRNASCGIV